MVSEPSFTIDYSLLKFMSEKYEVSQSRLAAGLGLNLGKMIYSQKTCIAGGLIAVNRLRCSDNKIVYAYLFASLVFLYYKMQKYEQGYNAMEELKPKAKVCPSKYMNAKCIGLQYERLSDHAA